MAKLIPTAPLSRQSALYGIWVGEVDQKTGIISALNKHIIHLQFNEGSQPITGKMKFEFKITGDELLDEDRYINAEIINTIYDGRVFKCDYENKDNNAIHCGTLYGELSSNGKTIKGEFLGYGLVSEQFVSGTVYLKKQNNLK